MIGQTNNVVVLYDKPEEFIETLRGRFPHVSFHACRSYNALPAVLKEVRPEVAFACKFEPHPFPRAAFFECSSLKWLSIGFAGIDHVVPWNDDTMIVTNASGVAAEEMAQYVLGAIYGLYQRFPYFAQRQAAHSWDYQLIRSAKGATIGLVGLGHTGEAIARLCRNVGLRVVACRSTDQTSDLVDRTYATSELHTLLGDVDVVVACAALTPATRDMFDHNAFAAFRQGSFFINVARGGMVVEDALVAALQSGQLGGAVIDVTRTEPLAPTDPLWDVPNLLITPHTSSEFAGWQARAAEMFADNLQRWLRGEPLQNRVYSRRGY